MLNMTSREFNQATAKAIKASKTAPVIVTKRGTPTCVLLDYADYQNLINQLKPRPSMAELLGGDGDIDDNLLNFDKVIIGLQPAKLD